MVYFNILVFTTYIIICVYNIYIYSHTYTYNTTAVPPGWNPSPEKGLAAYADASSGEVWMGHDGGPSLAAPDPSLGNFQKCNWQLRLVVSSIILQYIHIYRLYISMFFKAIDLICSQENWMTIPIDKRLHVETSNQSPSQCSSGSICRRVTFIDVVLADIGCLPAPFPILEEC